MKFHIQICCMLIVSFCCLITATAQDREIEGVVKDTDGIPLAGANIVEVGTTNGVITDFDGNFSMKVAASSNTIEISYIGYTTQRVALTDKNVYKIVMVSSNKLEEVVVTALGVRREEKALGYSVQKLAATEVSTVKTTNIVNVLSGKVSGVSITGGAGGPAASANINIRGAASLLGNNQPLFVVNGIPITNDLYSFDDGLNGSTTIDFGNAAQIVNPDDIASVNILKGPAASALYGARAADGVILIETKTGEGTKGWGVEINNSTMFSSILKMPDYQNEFGFGGFGRYSYLDGSNYQGTGGIDYWEAYGENWGPGMNGQEIIQFNSNGVPVPFTAAPDNIRDFFRMGTQFINNIAISNVTEDSDLRLSFTRTDVESIVPNSDLTRNTFQASLGKKLFDDKLNIRANAMYVNSGSGNIPNSGYDESSSIQYGWLWYPRQVHTDELRNYWEPGLEGIQQRYVENLWVNNPWLIVKENTNAFNSNRLIGNITLNYNITDRISLRLRYGADVLNEGRQYRRAPSTKAVPFGSYREDEISFTETNAEALLSYSSDRTNGNDFQYDLKVGGNIMRQNANFLVANNPQLKLLGTGDAIYTLANSRSGVLVESQKTETGINSIFGLATLSYKNYLYIDASLRNDWSSTLVNPIAGIENSEYSFLYPSVSVSAVISSMLDLPSNATVSFLKLKGNYAEVGNGAPPYAFGNTFTPQPSFGANPVFTTGRTIADPNLTNERTRAFEIGLDVRLWKDRFRMDATYYNQLSFDQIIELPTAASSGFDFRLTNGGAIRNQGVELLLSGTPVLNDNFSWDVTVNFGRNRAIVESLPDIIDSGRYSIVADMFPNDGGSDLEFVAEEGELYGQLYGLGFVRHPDTGEIIHQNGLPMVTEEKVSAGSYQPDFRLGVMNTFTLGQFRMSFLVDGQAGGKIYARSHALYATGGTITHNDDPNLPINTLDGRDTYSVSYDNNGDPVYTPDQQGGGVIGPGLNWEDLDGDEVIDYDTELSPNDVAVQPGGIQYVGYFYQYYGNGFNRDNIEAATYDATFFKLREVSIGYNIPKPFTDRLGMTFARVSLIGRNLLLFSNVPTIDPETYSVRNGIFVPGFESQQIFSARSYGFSINVGF